MENSLKSILTGSISGITSTYVAVPATAAAAAIAMPPGWSVATWSALVVFGLGALLPALIIQLAALLITRANVLVAFASFCITTIAAIALISGLTYAGNALAALLVGSIAATVVAGTLQPDNSSKPKPLLGQPQP